MAFYEYLMVFLPEVCPSSFLLFVHNPAGQTKFRDYSSGSERQLTVTLPAEVVIARTELGRTRFYRDAHATKGPAAAHWVQITRELNQTWLHPVPGNAPAPPAANASRGAPQGRARRGSQRQLQDYVNARPEALTAAVMAALPPRLSELGATIRWVSPLASDNYQEYRDGEFLAAVGSSDAGPQLADFWPSMGPCWDALGVVSDSLGRVKPGVILLEAKSHIEEIYGGGCKASVGSLARIERALSETKAWLGVSCESDWLGPLYQYGNRLAYLYFLLKRIGRPAWLVNLYFVADPIGPTSEEQWRTEIAKVKNSLGLSDRIPNAVDVFLPAFSNAETNGF